MSDERNIPKFKPVNFGQWIGTTPESKQQLQIGAWVLIHNLPDNGTDHEGEIGTLVDINQQNDNGDCYGVDFSGEESEIVYYFRGELTVLTEEEVERDRRAREADEKDMQQIASEWRAYRDEGLGYRG